MKYVGQSLSPIVLGIVLLHFDLDTVFMVSGSFGLFIALITYLLMKKFASSGDVTIKGTDISLSDSPLGEPLDDVA